MGPFFPHDKTSDHRHTRAPSCAVASQKVKQRLEANGQSVSLMGMTTAAAVFAERGVSRAMGGSCSMPLAAHTTIQNDTLTIHAVWGYRLKFGVGLIHACDRTSLDLHNPDNVAVLVEAVHRYSRAQRMHRAFDQGA